MRSRGTRVRHVYVKETHEDRGVVDQEREVDRNAHGVRPLTDSGMSAGDSGCVFTLVTVLAELPSLLSDAGRTALIRQLPPEIATLARQDPRPRLYLLNLVQTCLEHEGGLAEMLTALCLIEGDSIPMRRVLAVAHALFGVSLESLPRPGSDGRG